MADENPNQQPENDATYTPASQPRKHGAPNTFNPAGQSYRVDAGQFPGVDIPLHLEPVDVANTKALMRDVLGRIGGQAEVADRSVQTFVVRIETVEIAPGVWREAIGVQPLNY